MAKEIDTVFNETNPDKLKMIKFFRDRFWPMDNFSDSQLLYIVDPDT